MKKLFCALMVTLLLACNNDTKDTGAKALNNDAPELMSLNGFTETDTRDMVTAYKNDKRSSDPQTSFWFSEKFIDAATDAAAAGGQTVDGIRIHLGKRAGKNVLVMLLTTDAGPHPKDTTKRIHKEFFSPAIDLLRSVNVRSVDSFYPIKGAELFTSTNCGPVVCTMGPHVITCREAKKWVGDFVDLHSSGEASIDTKSVWYPIDLFKRIKEDILDGRPNNKTDGFRIYLAKGDKGVCTFILMPTFEISGGNHQDDFTCYNNKVREAYDKGEECETFCDGIIL